MSSNVATLLFDVREFNDRTVLHFNLLNEHCVAKTRFVRHLNCTGVKTKISPCSS